MFIHETWFTFLSPKALISILQNDVTSSRPGQLIFGSVRFHSNALVCHRLQAVHFFLGLFVNKKMFYPNVIFMYGMFSILQKDSFN